jgi:hypothetical protein
MHQTARHVAHGLSVWGWVETVHLRMPVDVVEKPDSYELHASLPGVPKETVKVCDSQPCHRPPVWKSPETDAVRWWCTAGCGR